MLERKKFMTEWDRERGLGRVNFAALCRAFGITRHRLQVASSLSRRQW